MLSPFYAIPTSLSDVRIHAVPSGSGLTLTITATSTSPSQAKADAQEVNGLIEAPQRRYLPSIHKLLVAQMPEFTADKDKIVGIQRFSGLELIVAEHWLKRKGRRR